MQRMIPLLILLACFMFTPAAPAAAWFFDSPLVTIDGEKVSAKEFKRWWSFWNTEKKPLPENPDFYVDWLLLSREGQKMEIDQDPGFKRQTRVYLQSRGLLMLKYEAVDSRIKITDKDVEERYRRDYGPQWLVQRLNFKDEQTALAAHAQIGAGTLTITQLLERQPADGGPGSTAEDWIRPIGTDPKWLERFGQTEVGAIINPDSHDRGAILYYLKEKKEGDAEDLASQRQRIEKALRREQEGALTAALLRELREKYQVKVDEERLASLDIKADDSTFGDAPVISTNRENVSEKQFIAVIRRLLGSRPVLAHSASDKDGEEQLKSETVNNIIAQSVTNWESLERHYEEREPFKWEYLFNYNHRMTLALQQRLFTDEAKVDEAQIEQHYRENISRYSRPAMVKLYIIDETQGPVDRFWADVATGKNFAVVLREHFEQQISSQEVPLNHLDPEIKAVASTLVKGETSQVFTAQGVRVIVHLVESTPEMPLPLEQVKDSIHSELWEKNLERVAQNYLDKIKSQSVVKVNMRKWKSLRKEIGGVR